MLLYDLFQSVLNMSLTASVMIMVVLIVRMFIKKLPKVFSYVLWGVVLFRLLCPVAISTDFSLLNLFDVTATEDGSMKYLSASESLDAISFTDAAKNDSKDGDTIEKTVPSETLAETAEPTLTEETRSTIVSLALLGENLEIVTGISLNMLIGIWIAGILTLLLVGLIQLFKLRQRLIGSVLLKDNIYLADYIETPFVFGFFRPRIYLPSGLTTEEQAYVILHEQYHIRRFDYVIKILAFLALCVYWFNPFVWIAFFMSEKDMEMSCDEAVIGQVDKDIRTEYSASLLQFASGRKISVGVPLAFGESNTKVRIQNIMKYKKPVKGVIAMGILLVVAIGMILMTNPRGNTQTSLAGANYSVEEVLYTIVDDPEVLEELINMEKSISYSITAEMGLYTKTAEAEDWEYRGQMEPYQMTKEDMEIYTMYENGWISSYNIGDITEAYILRGEEDSFYMAMQMKNGDVLLGTGWEDVDVPTGDGWKDVGERGQERQFVRIYRMISQS